MPKEGQGDLLVHFVTDILGVYPRFVDVDWIRLCIFSDERARRLLLPDERSLANVVRIGSKWR